MDKSHSLNVHRIYSSLKTQPRRCVCWQWLCLSQRKAWELPSLRSAKKMLLPLPFSKKQLGLKKKKKKKKTTQSLTTSTPEWFHSDNTSQLCSSPLASLQVRDSCQLVFVVSNPAGTKSSSVQLRQPVWASLLERRTVRCAFLAHAVCCSLACWKLLESSKSARGSI